jgi:ribose/xylose/arabinose/galactoside ABC-type transport system permease subunit
LGSMAVGTAIGSINATLVSVFKINPLSRPSEPGL